jgi:hypothetical protein
MYVSPTTGTVWHGYRAINPKWHPIPAQLGYFRPNQAMNRGIYAERALGQELISGVPNWLLLVGGGLLAAAALGFFGARRRRVSKERRIARLAAQRAIATRELREAGA